jgi:hypothetical protein
VVTGTMRVTAAKGVWVTKAKEVVESHRIAHHFKTEGFSHFDTGIKLLA